MQNDQAWL